MWQLLKTFLACFCIAIIGYVAFTASGMDWQTIYTRYFPCKKPIAYTLGTFDRDFGITEKEFLDALTEAEAMWEDGTGRDLFVYDTEGALKINLIYDYRQEATDKIAALDNASSGDRAKYNALVVAHEKNVAAYDAATRAYEARANEFENKQDAYQAEVKYWNARGGAPEAEYNKLQKEEAVQKSEYEALKADEATLRSQIKTVNDEVGEINTLARKLNLNVATLNKINEHRGEEFTEGEYVMENNRQEINVYEFRTDEKLVRVLAHELGHALGLDHVDDKNAVMYYLNNSKNGALAKADRVALDTLCGAKSE